MTVFYKLLEVHLNFFLIFILGNVAVTLAALREKQNAPQNSHYGLDLCLNLTFGILVFACLSALALIIPYPALFLRITLSLLFLTWVTIKCNSSSQISNLKSMGQFYLRFGIIPTLVFLPAAFFLLCHFNSNEIAKGIDPWQIVVRTSAYNVPDSYLQWLVSDSFYNNKPLEKHFNHDGHQLWSAGDRPVLIGLLESGFSHLSGHHNFSLYFLRVIFIGSFLFLPLYYLLKDEFSVTSKYIRAAIILFFFFYPFYLINLIYTWPKMAGLALGVSGIFLLSHYFKSKRTILSLAAGAAIALGMISHAAALFCILAAVAYFVLKSILWKTDVFKKPLGIVPFLIPLLLITQIHSKLLASVTIQTNLLPRVQFCRGGSYGFVTPIESVQESCRKYFEIQGWSGIISDRKESLRRALNFHVEHEWAKLLDLLSGSPEQRKTILTQKFTESLLVVPETIGQFSLLILSILGILYLISGCLKNKFFQLAPSSLLAPIGFGLLILFGTGLAAYEEMSSHVVPYIIPFLIHTGIMIELSRLSKIIFFTWYGLIMSVSIAIWTLT